MECGEITAYAIGNPATFKTAAEAKRFLKNKGRGKIGPDVRVMVAEVSPGVWHILAGSGNWDEALTICRGSRGWWCWRATGGYVFPELMDILQGKSQ